ncbi:MAG: hypothetical protein ABI351_13875 [Herbaspirillum sp.]
MDIPSALLPSDNSASNDPLASITNVSLDYTYQTSSQSVSDAPSFWDEVVSSTENATQGTWNAVQGAWTTTKQGLGDAITGIENVGSGVTNWYEGIITFVRDNIIIMFAVLIGGIWIIAKSGILKDASKFLVLA